MLVKSFAIILLYFQYAQCLHRVDPLVETNVGLIRGLRADDGDYSMFLGIPYAQVNPDNPFGESKPHPKFEETLEAYDGSAICPQVYQLNNTILGTVDCLQLNVYVPSSATTKNPLPVIVWIYGGSFHTGFFGKQLYGPTYLVKHDVILVTLNYRVGAYGFMCLDTPDVPGNQGLKDQLLALRWINDNIQAFGGDVNRITLFGESAGGHSVDFHLISEKEKLYNNVIIDSGSSMASTVLYKPDREAPLKIAENLGFDTKDTNKALSFLAKVDPNLVVGSAVDLGITFKPCVENNYDGLEPFLSSSWINAAVPKVKNMPVLIGFNEHELAGGYIGFSASYYQNLNTVADYLEQVFDLNENEFKEVEKLIHNFYFGDEAISADVMYELTDLASDMTYIHPIQRSIAKYLEAGVGNLYHYMFSYVGGRNAINIEDGKCCASHADELSYIFDMKHKPEPTEQDLITIERITTMWTNFAKYSDPTPETSELLPVKWTPLTKNKYSYMNIGAELKLGSRPAHSRMSFWNLLYKLIGDRQKF